MKIRNKKFEKEHRKPTSQVEKQAHMTFRSCFHSLASLEYKFWLYTVQTRHWTVRSALFPTPVCGIEVIVLVCHTNKPPNAQEEAYRPNIADCFDYMLVCQVLVGKRAVLNIEGNQE